MSDILKKVSEAKTAVVGRVALLEVHLNGNINDPMLSLLARDVATAADTLAHALDELSIEGFKQITAEC